MALCLVLGLSLPRGAVRSRLGSEPFAACVSLAGGWEWSLLNFHATLAPGFLALAG